MTLILTATGQPVEIEECTEAGYYARVAGHARFLPSEAVTHPQHNACPTCGSALARSYDRLGVYLECTRAECYYIATAPALFEAHV